MSRKDVRTSDESFTLQFGEPNDQNATDEELSSDGAFVDDQFMWNNATAVLEDAQKVAKIVPVPDVLPTEPAIKEQPVVAAAPAPVADTVEPVADASGDGIDDDEEPMVLDERQAEMIRAPYDRNGRETAPAIDDDVNLDVLTVGVPSLAEPHMEEDTKPALFSDDDDADELPRVLPPIAAGKKAPWVLYGTLGLGVAVVSVAAVGMLLQLGNSGEDAGPVDVTEFEEQQDVLPVAVVDETPIDPQLKVFRLAVGPFIDNDSHLNRPAIDAPFVMATPTSILDGAPDRIFAADLGASLPVALAAVTGGNFDAEPEATAVVTMASDRIEIDMTDGEGTVSGEDEIALATAASLTIDRTIEGSDAPELVAINEGENDAANAQSLTLFDAISQASNEVSRLDSKVLEREPFDNTSQWTKATVSSVDEPLNYAEQKYLTQYDLNAETGSGLTVPELPRAPLVAVRLASADARILPNDVRSDAGFNAALPVPRPDLPEVSRFVDPVLRDPNLPVPEIDVTGALLAAAKAAMAESERLRLVNEERARIKAAEEEAARIAAAKAAEEEAARIAAAEAAKAAEEEAARIAAAEAAKAAEEEAARIAAAEAAKAAEEEAARIAAAEAAKAAEEEAARIAVAEAAKAAEELSATLVPVQSDMTTPSAGGSVGWVAQATWIPELGFSVSPITQSGQAVLEIRDIQEGSVLPEWAKEGSTIITANSSSVESEQSLLAALLDGANSTETGNISASLELRARAGLNPRSARIKFPVWRSVTLGDGTALTVRPKGDKWITEVSADGSTADGGLMAGDILLRDFMTKSNMRSPLALEELLEKMTEAGETRVEFAIMRDGELSSGGISLQN